LLLTLAAKRVTKKYSEVIYFGQKALYF